MLTNFTNQQPMNLNFSTSFMRLFLFPFLDGLSIFLFPYAYTNHNIVILVKKVIISFNKLS